MANHLTSHHITTISGVWSTEVRGMGPGPSIKVSGCGAGLAWALSIKVKGLHGGQAGPGPVDKSGELGAELAGSGLVLD